MTSTTPFFPALRARLAALGSRTAESLRQLDFLPLGDRLRRLLPAHLLASEDEGPGSRDRIFSLRLTFECFSWQFLKPNTCCRDVVRALQALFQSQSWGEVAEGNSAYVQARQRLPQERLRQAMVATAQTANRQVGSQGFIHGRPVKVADRSTVQLPNTASNQLVCPQASGQRRAPKVTVTRRRVSLCQKGVTRWLLLLVNCFWAPMRVKTSRGAGCEPPARAPLRSKSDALPRRGGRGGGLVGRVIHNGLRRDAH